MAALLLGACQKQNMTCECSVNTQTRLNSGGSISSVTHQEKITISQTTKNKAKAGECADVTKVEVLAQVTNTITRMCSIH